MVRYVYKVIDCKGGESILNEYDSPDKFEWDAEDYNADFYEGDTPEESTGVFVKKDDTTKRMVIKASERHPNAMNYVIDMMTEKFECAVDNFDPRCQKDWLHHIALARAIIKALRVGDECYLEWSVVVV
jgi:hypothetical protein